MNKKMFNFSPNDLESTIEHMKAKDTGKRWSNDYFEG